MPDMYPTGACVVGKELRTKEITAGGANRPNRLELALRSSIELAMGLVCGKWVHKEELYKVQMAMEDKLGYTSVQRIVLSRLILSSNVALGQLEV